MSVCGCAPECRCLWRPELLATLVLEFWVVVGCCLTWLGIEPLLSARAAHTLNLRAIFLAPTNDF